MCLGGKSCMAISQELERFMLCRWHAMGGFQQKARLNKFGMLDNNDCIF